MQAYLGTIMCKFGGDPAICLREAIFVTSQKCPYHVTFDLDLDLEHTLDAGRAGNHLVQVCSVPAICLQEEAIFVKSQKYPYHMTFDSTLILSTSWMQARLGTLDHDVQVRSQSSHLSGRRSDLRKVFTDRPTDDGCRTIALAHAMR